MAETEFSTGCTICGHPLRYFPTAQLMTCSCCGIATSSNARCAAAGHHVCDVCHSGSAKDVIERTCLAATSTDPLAISRQLMRHPKVKLHGPEHHLIVAGALLAAHASACARHDEKPRLLAEARRRTEPVIGGFCGLQGACGAAIGAGTYVSIVTGASPLATEPWALANAATASALGSIAKVGGPRCCKRTTWLAILAGVQFARRHLGVELGREREACGFSEANAECIRGRCPFHPRS